MARRRCRQYAIRAVRIAPKTAPGKKPARMPSVVKSGQLDGATDLSARALGEGVCSVLETGVIVVPVVLVGEAAVVCVEDVDAEVNAQNIPVALIPKRTTRTTTARQLVVQPGRLHLVLWVQRAVLLLYVARNRLDIRTVLAFWTADDGTRIVQVYTLC